MKIPVTRHQMELLNVLFAYTNRNDSHRGKRKAGSPIPKYGVIAKKLGTTARRITSRMHELKKKGIIEIGNDGKNITVLVVGQVYIPEEHESPETKPKGPDRESRLACIAFVTGHKPWQIELGTKY